MSGKSRRSPVRSDPGAPLRLILPDPGAGDPLDLSPTELAYGRLPRWSDLDAPDRELVRHVLIKAALRQRSRRLMGRPPDVSALAMLVGTLLILAAIATWLDLDGLIA